MTVPRRASAAAAALLALAATAGPATAAPAGPPPRHSHLFLSVSGSDDTWVRGVSLYCDPPSGFHPHAQLACKALEGAHGKLDALAPDRHMCPMVYAPVIATATGTWHGRPVSWERTFSNSCVLDARTGSVFRF
ncbi:MULTISPECIES: SSI family serine proteinase inhibitor [Streptomycetaceae]|uniref:SSI family serine proteinase inhibitor n=1 Tax=Streptomycetaceae TaxID=2062 RepID=UPI000213EE54|nr:MULTISPECIES: SSI family serine proteinase inhibitor [Streptomycetaceae]MYS57481.1 protease inhibitor [Streptomyces sp. SID5468]CCB73069.1 Protease inhibitor [Streptantibioticus cattleyicolor NRRL 8057 = DSM 46488]